MSLFEHWVIQVVAALVCGLFRNEHGPALTWRVILVPLTVVAIVAVLRKAVEQ